MLLSLVENPIISLIRDAKTRIMKIKQFLLSAIVFFSAMMTGIAQSPTILVVGANSSMSEKINGNTKVDLINDALQRDLDITDLVIYGEWENDCKGITWSDRSGESIADNADMNVSIDPMGPRAIANGLRAVLDSIMANQIKATVILVADGMDECDGLVCETIKAGQGQGLTFKLNVIGLDVSGESFSDFRCGSDLTEGQFINATDSVTFFSALEQSFANSVDLPTANFILDATRNNQLMDAEATIVPRDPDLPTTVLRTYGDTVSTYLAPGIYDLQIKPLTMGIFDEQSIKGLEIPSDTITSQTVTFNVGVMKVACQLNGTPWDCMVKVADSQSGEVIDSNRTFGKDQTIELAPGRYDVRMTANRIEGVTSAFVTREILVKKGDTTSVEHEFATGKILVGVKGANGLIDANVTIKASGKEQPVSTGRTFSTKSTNPREFLLTPGKYDITLEALPLNGKDATTTLQDIEVTGGEKTMVEHLYEFGRLSVTVSNEYGPSEAMIVIQSRDGETTYATGRSSADDEASRDFLLTSGDYWIKVQEVGKDASSARQEKVTVETGEMKKVEIKF